MYLEDADGMEIVFPEGITDHGRRLMDTLGVTVNLQTTRERDH